MLSQTMVEQLNEQINLEFFSSNLYLQMSAWCEDKGFEGAAEFFTCTRRRRDGAHATPVHVCE